MESVPHEDTVAIKAGSGAYAQIHIPLPDGKWIDEGDLNYTHQRAGRLCAGRGRLQLKEKNGGEVGCVVRGGPRAR